MRVRAFDIEYETDGYKVNLPTEITFEVDDDFDPEMELADEISDETGWLVLACDYEMLD